MQVEKTEMDKPLEGDGRPLSGFLMCGKSRYFNNIE